MDPKELSNFISEREICISIAASVRDVCKHNPDRGVDLILSVSVRKLNNVFAIWFHFLDIICTRSFFSDQQSCIESQDCTVQGLGFESLAYLCEADLVGKSQLASLLRNGAIVFQHSA